MLVGRRKKILSEKCLRRTLPQPKTSIVDVIVMSHHRNNANVKYVPQFCKTKIPRTTERFSKLKIRFALKFKTLKSGIRSIIKIISFQL